nr:leucine-rich repeat domain-containing protein [uncultured Prevotella sp.]
MKKYLLTMLAVLAGSNMWAQSFSYTESNKTLTIVVTEDLSKDNDAAGKVQTEMATDKPETVIVNGGGKINSDFIKAILYGKNPSGSEVYAIANKDTKTLDLGNVVLVDWTTNTFCGSWGHIDKDITITTLTLPKTPDNIIPDYPFIGKDSWGNFWPIEQIIIPDGCVRIGAYFAKNMSTLEMVKWPDSVKEIGDMAFANLTKWNIPALPKKLEIIGNSAFALTSWVTCKTITFPSSLKIICQGAFLMRQYQEVYFQSKTAPLLPLGESLIQPSYGNMTAFGAETLMGNNGCNGPTSKYADNFSEGKANRENYVASSGAYFCILHFPKGLTDEEKATYTDITKKI